MTQATQIYFVPPSGDTSGVTDTAAIQAAIDALQASVTTYSIGRVWLSGYYYLNDTLTLGAVNTNTKVLLWGDGLAVLKRVGDAGTAGYYPYCIKVYGGYSGTRTPLRNLRLFCEEKCRGILWAGASLAGMDDVQVYGSKESGIDLIGCWSLNLRNVSISNFKGYGIRGYQNSGCHFDSVTCVNGFGLVSSNHSTISDANLVDYAMQNGGIAGVAGWSETNQGVLGTVVWPASDDTVCEGFTGTAFNLADDYRSVWYFVGDGTTWTNLCFEECHYVDYPLLYINGSSRNLVTSARLEANKNMLEKVHITSGSHNAFRFVSTTDGHPLGGSDYTQPLAEDACECFLRCEGTTIGNLVERLAGNTSLTDAIVILDGGTHTGTIVRECYSKCGEIAAANWIGEANTPTVDADWDDGESS